MIKQQKPPEYMRIKIELRGIEPMIWRRIVLPSRSSLSILHRVIQASMGWEESHLHQFEKDGLAYGPDYAWDPDFGPPLLSQNKQLKSIFTKPGEWLRYEYDFGDSWVHLIEFEHWMPMPESGKLPLCIGGKGTCPPEDCGGEHGYVYMLQVMQDKEHQEYDSMREWLGGEFDPDSFDLQDVNQRLRKKFT